MSQLRLVQSPPVHLIEVDVIGRRTERFIHSDDPEYGAYLALYERGERASDRLALWDFELFALRGPWATVWAWLRGVP